MYSDDQLIYMYRQEDETAYDYLLKEYSEIIEMLVRYHGRLLKNMAFDFEECLSQGLGCFVNCVDNYCATKNASFKTYFNLRFNYTMINYRSQLSKKYKNELELSTEVDYIAVMDALKSNQYCFDPGAMLYYKETVNESKQTLEGLTGIEKEVAGLYLMGKDYKEICASLHYDHKAISNALYRVRQKLRNSTTLI